MEPILECAPRRLDGRLSIFLWPYGIPVAYRSSGGEGALCGNCAAAEEAKGARFNECLAQGGIDHFRCKACGLAFCRETARYLSYPMPGGRRVAWPNQRALITLSNRRISPLEWETPPGLDSLADEEPRSEDLDRARQRMCNGLPLTDAEHKLLIHKGLMTTGPEGSTFLITPRHIVYPYLSTIPKEGISDEDERFNWAMDAIDLFRWLRHLVGGALQLLKDKRWDEGFKELRRLRRIQPKHFETWARLAVGLESAGRTQEAEWEWLGLAEAYAEAGLHEHADLAGKKVFW